MRTMAATAVIMSLVVVGCSSSGKSGSSATTTASTVSPTSASTASTTSTTTGLDPPASVHGLRIRAASAPNGIVTPKARWLRVDRPDGKTQRVAVFRPRGTGAHPVIVYLHGASGLAETQLRWAPKLAAAGFIVVAGCYLGVDPAAPRPTSHTWVPCPGLPDQAHADAATFNRAYGALLDTAAALPGGRSGALGVFAASLGAIFALTSSERRLKAIVADSGFGNNGPDPITTPVMLLGTTGDPNVPHAKVVAFEKALRDARKPVESHYYDGTGHVVTLGPKTNADDATRRAATFLHSYLG